MTFRLLAACALLAAASTAAGPKEPAPKPGPADQAVKPEELPAEGESDAPEQLPPGMTAGPAKVTLGENAELSVPEGVVFGDAATARKIMEQSGNLVSNQEAGILLMKGSTVIFEFDPVGYVKDDDKDKLDPEKMLSSLREGQEEANKELAKLGRPQLELTRWAVKPHYDDATHNMEWAPVVKNKENGHETVNYNVRLLGRRGVMEATLLVNPEGLEAELPVFRGTLKGFGFKAGEDYASWREGDKVAEYGLAALVTGGAVAVAAKSGLLGKLWKLIVAGVAALVAGIQKLFGKKQTTVVAQDQQRGE